MCKDNWSLENIKKRVEEISKNAEKQAGKHMRIIGTSTVFIDWKGFFKELRGRKE